MTGAYDGKSLFFCAHFDAKCSGNAVVPPKGSPSVSNQFGETAQVLLHMAIPYRRKNSRFYWADVWYGGKKRSTCLRTDNYGVARSILHQRLAALRERGLQLPTKTPADGATTNRILVGYVLAMVTCRRNRQALFMRPRGN